MAVDDEARLVAEHTGRRDLPLAVRLAIRSMTRRHPDDPDVWLKAARALRHTSNGQWAYRCYQRAARLAPNDLALAEEVGLYGATFGRQLSRSFPTYLVRARAEASRRPRTDPVLMRMAGPLLCELSIVTVPAALIAMLVGVTVVRRGEGVQTTLPPGFDALPPVVGSLAAAGVLVVFGLLGWLAFRPIHRFGHEILWRVLRQPRTIDVLAVVGAIASVVGSVVVAGFGGTNGFDTYGVWMLPIYAVTMVLALIGMPRGTLRELASEVIKQ